MLNNKKIIVVMPAYNAGITLKMTYDDIDKNIVDDIILTDDCSSDNTVELSKSLNIKTFVHNKNLGYGANQKTCYNKALEMGADIIILLHPDYQYDPRLIPEIAKLIAYEECDFVIASRFLGNDVKKSKMPKYKYFANRFLTIFQNFCFKKNFSEYHSGYRAYSTKLLKTIDYNSFDNDFIFDNQIITAIIENNFKTGEISCPVRYFDSASSINFIRSVKYGLGVLFVTFKYLIRKYLKY